MIHGKEFALRSPRCHAAMPKSLTLRKSQESFQDLLGPNSSSYDSLLDEVTVECPCTIPYAVLNIHTLLDPDYRCSFP